MVSGTPHCKGGGRCPSAVQFGGSLPFLRTSIDAELPNVMREGLVFRCQPYPSEGGSLALPNFWSSLIYIRTLFVVELENLSR